MNSIGTRKGKILVVEDEPEIRQVCRRTLASQGYQVDFAPTGTAAEDMLREEDYDLILVDIRTPGKNGRQLYQHIKDSYSRLTDRVIFTTGDVVSNDTQGFLKQTSRPFLLKPFTPDELKDIVRKTLSRFH